LVATQLDNPPTATGSSPDRSDQLFSAALAIVSARTVDEMLRETTTRAARIIGAHQASTSLTVDRDAGQPLTATYRSTGTARSDRPGDDGGLSGPATEVCRTNRPIRLTQAELERRSDWQGTSAANRGGSPPSGFLGVPLVGHEGHNLGLIGLWDRIHGNFDAGDEELLTSLAQFTAMAIEQLRLHADLAYQSHLTRTVTENATSGLFLLDAEMRVTYMNSAARHITGQGFEDLRARPLHDAVHHSRPDGTPLPISECRIWRTVIGERTNLEPFEDWFIRPDGSFYPVRLAAAPIVRGDEIVSVVLEVQDISVERAVARRLRDLALSASDRAAKLRGLIESIGDPVVVADRNGAVSLANPAAIEIFGPRLVEVDQLWARLRSEDGKRISPDGEIEGSYQLEGTDRETWVEVRAFPVPIGATGHSGDATDPEGDHGRIYVLRDITFNRHARVLRETFIGMLSHELRTPITTVYGGAKVLARHAETFAPVVRSIVADIEAESERLYRLVEDLVVLTKSEASSLEAGREPVLLQRILPRLVSAESQRWPAVEFNVTATTGMPPVLAEQTYLEQIVRNLLTNAAKYGGAETIEVIGEYEGDEVIVRVLDRGPGFPEGDAARLFDIYYRSPQMTRRAAGAGIGLFVSKALVDAMRGRIWATEREGGGAEFGFALRAVVEPGDDDSRASAHR
jgi:PAS domain S-box-containing protein